MIEIANFALFGWIPAIFFLFALLSPRQAVIASFVIGYLFLPEIHYQWHTLPDFTKVSATAIGVLLASLLFDGGRYLTFRLRLIDIPAIVLCLSPIVTSHLNNLGIMDGLSGFANRFCHWALPYFIGRVYFNDWDGIRQLAIGIMLGGLAYLPLCWWEIKMSPQLHKDIYGIGFASFRQDSGLFGFRPNVFLRDGLNVTMFMGFATLMAFWLWMSGSLRRVLGMPISWIVIALFVTTLFSKALGGFTLLLAGAAVLTAAKRFRTKLPALLLILAAPTYMAIRMSGSWSGDRMAEVIDVISVTRGNSLRYRLFNEGNLMVKAMEQPWFGWGGWGRAHVFDAKGHDISISDGLWIILLGEHGFVGLFAFTGMVLLPALIVWKKIPPRLWAHPAVAAAPVLAIAISEYMVDGLFNATFNPIATLSVGAVAAITAAIPVANESRAARAAGARNGLGKGSKPRFAFNGAGPAPAPAPAPAAHRQI